MKFGTQILPLALLNSLYIQNQSFSIIDFFQCLFCGFSQDQKLTTPFALLQTLRKWNSPICICVPLSLSLSLCVCVRVCRAELK